MFFFCRRPTGQSAPATSPTTHPSLDSATFQCEFPGCERSFQTTIDRGQHHRRMHKAWYDQRIIAARQTFGWTLEESFPHRTIGAISQHRRSQPYKGLVTHIPASPRPSRRQSFTSSITSGANAGTEGGFLPPPLPPMLCSYTYRTCRELIPPAIKQSASTTSCATPVTPPKAPSSSGYLVTCRTSFHLARPTTDQRRQPTNSNGRAGKPDAETLALQPHAMYQEHPGRCRGCQAAT